MKQPDKWNNTLDQQKFREIWFPYPPASWVIIDDALVNCIKVLYTSPDGNYKLDIYYLKLHLFQDINDSFFTLMVSADSIYNFEKLY